MRILIGGRKIKKIYIDQKVTTFSFICRIIFEKYFIKAVEDFLRVYIALSKHLRSWKNSRQLLPYFY